MIVVKVGGSLYDWPGLGPALRGFVASLHPASILLVPGGGGFADAVRKLHAVHRLTEGQSHRLALESLWVPMRFLRTLVPGAEYRSHPTPDATLPVCVLDAHMFCEYTAPDLPHTWEVTTDSIAARAAVVWQAERLILLKSIDVSPGTPWDVCAARGWVDGYFTHALAGVAGTVEAVNLRTWGGVRVG